MAHARLGRSALFATFLAVTGCADDGPGGAWTSLPGAGSVTALAPGPDGAVVLAYSGYLDGAGRWGEWLLSLDRDGVLDWWRTLDTRARALAVDGAGQVYVVRDGADGVIEVHDGAGLDRWIRTGGSICGLATDRTSGVWAMANLGAGSAFDGTTVDEPGMHVVRLSGTPGLLHRQALGPYCLPFAVAHTGHAAAYVSGVLTAFDPHGDAYFRLSVGDVTAFQIDGAGRIVATGPLDDWDSVERHLPQGSVVLDVPTLPTRGGRDVWVARLERSRAWGRVIAGPGRDAPSAVALDDDGNVVVVGGVGDASFVSRPVVEFAGLPITQVDGDRGVFVAGFDGDGALDLAGLPRGPGADAPTHVVCDHRGGIVVAGSFSGTMDFPDATHTRSTPGAFVTRWAP